jgi:hypothetical protein
MACALGMSKFGVHEGVQLSAFMQNPRVLLQAFTGYEKNIFVDGIIGTGDCPYCNSAK